MAVQVRRVLDGSHAQGTSPAAAAAAAALGASSMDLALPEGGVGEGSRGAEPAAEQGPSGALLMLATTSPG